MAAKIKYKPFAAEEAVFNSRIGFFLGYEKSEFIRLVEKYEPEVILDKDEIDESTESDGQFMCCDVTDSTKVWRQILIAEFDVLLLKFDDNQIDAMGTLMHECIHAAQNVCDSRGLPTGWDEPEVLAYLAEFYFKNALTYVMREQQRIEKQLQKKHKAKKKVKRKRERAYDEED